MKRLYTLISGTTDLNLNIFLCSSFVEERYCNITYVNHFDLTDWTKRQLKASRSEIELWIYLSFVPFACVCKNARNEASIRSTISSLHVNIVKKLKNVNK